MDSPRGYTHHTAHIIVSHFCGAFPILFFSSTFSLLRFFGFTFFFVHLLFTCLFLRCSSGFMRYNTSPLFTSTNRKMVLVKTHKTWQVASTSTWVRFRCAVLFIACTWFARRTDFFVPFSLCFIRFRFHGIHNFLSILNNSCNRLCYFLLFVWFFSFFVSFSLVPSSTKNV